MGKKEEKPYQRLEKDLFTNSFGEYLKRERELREITLREISDETKISYRYLEALEKDDDARLPAEVFIKGFIRSYAQYIGLDKDEVLLHYQEYKKVEGETQDHLSTKAPVSRHFLHQIRNPWIFLLIFFLLTTVLIFYGIHRIRKPAPGPVVSSPHSVEQAIPESPEGVGRKEIPRSRDLSKNEAVSTETQEAPSGSGIADVAPPPIKITFSALERTWFTCDVDGTDHHDVTLRPGETLHLRMRHSIRLNIGNAGGLLIRSHGRTLGPFGVSGQVRKDLLLTRDDFLGP